MYLLRFLINNSKRLLLTVCLVGSIQSHCSGKGLPKEYYEIDDVNKAKEYFFEHLYALVLEENEVIKEEREFITNVLTSNILDINYDSETFSKLLYIKEKYKVENIYSLEDYLKKVDIIPPSLALAQAAIESGWGKSRFIKEANNIFGHWTYDSKYGIIPKQRKFGASHFVRVFQSLRESVSAYMLNLNRNLAYKSFQEKRYEQRISQKHPEGLVLSQTMLNYSGIAQDYLKILKDIILFNNLQNFDRRFYHT